MIVNSETEALFVMKLIYEWNRKVHNVSFGEKVINKFHGPESHIWGLGPRIMHHNAGVYYNGGLGNVHIFFGKPE